MYRKAIYPGTFDPITFGHIDIIRRASKIFDHITIGISSASEKATLFTLEERLEITNVELNNTDILNYDVVIFDGLLVDFAYKNNIYIIIRGLRALSDFELEFKMSYINHQINSSIETLFIPANKGHFVASSVAKEIERLGGDSSKLVSNYIANKMRQKYKSKKYL